ncbi:MAG: LptF/LptG family permease, partial [Hyphomicrobium sp.]
RYWSELVHPGADSKIYKNNAGQFRAEINERLASPLYPLAFAFIIIAFVGQARSTRSSRMQTLVLTFLFAAGCRMVGLALNSAVARNPAMLFALYGVPVGAVIVSMIVIRRAKQQRRPSRLAETIVDFFSSAVAGVSRLVLPRRKLAS